MTEELDMDRFAELMKEVRAKSGRPHAFDFCKPIGHGCELCGYPLSNEGHKMKAIDCPEHMPDHWKYLEREAYKEAYGD